MKIQKPDLSSDGTSGELTFSDSYMMKTSLRVLLTLLFFPDTVFCHRHRADPSAQERHNRGARPGLSNQMPTSRLSRTGHLPAHD